MEHNILYSTLMEIPHSGSSKFIIIFIKMINFIKDITLKLQNCYINYFTLLL